MIKDEEEMSTEDAERHRRAPDSDEREVVFMNEELEIESEAEEESRRRIPLDEGEEAQ